MFEKGPEKNQAVKAEVGELNGNVAGRKKVFNNAALRSKVVVGPEVVVIAVFLLFFLEIFELSANPCYADGHLDFDGLL